MEHKKENNVFFGTLVPHTDSVKRVVCSDIKTSAVQGVVSMLPHLGVIVIVYGLEENDLYYNG